MLLEEVVPYLATTLGVKLLVFEGNVDATLERRIECLDSVCRQEHDAFVVFEHTEEDRDELVALQLVETAFFKEYIGFVLLPYSQLRSGDRNNWL